MRRRRRTLARRLCLAAFSVALAVATTGPAMAQRTSDPAAEPCSVFTPAVRSDTRAVSYQVVDGTPSVTVLRPEKLGYVPIALANDSRFDWRPEWSPFFSVSPDGVLSWTIPETRLEPDGTVGIHFTRQPVRSGWQGVRAMADTYYSLFALSGGTLTRYEKGWTPEYGLAHRTVIHGSFTDIRTLASWPAGSSADSDALLATTRAGALIEYVIARSGSASRSVTLSRSGFGSYASLSTGPCEIDGSQALLAITDQGVGYTFFDPVRADESASDFVRTRVTSGWRATTYGQ